MSDFQIPGKDLLTSVDRAADSFLVYDNSALGLKRTTIDYALDLTSHPAGINDIQTLTNKTLTAPAISSPVLSGTITGTYTFGGTPTFPAAVVTLTGVQTLTNKTLTSPTINTAVISNPTLTVDSINEFTSANGVTIDGVLLKDSTMNGSYITDATVTTAKIAANNVGIIRLSSTESTDVQNGTALTANTWTDAIANKNFTVDNSTSVIQISYTGSMQILSASSTFGSSRLVVDSAGTPQNIKYGGAPITSAQGCNPVAGGSTISITGLSAGTHTVKLQVLCGASGNQYLRASSQPNQEFMTCTVVEIKK